MASAVARTYNGGLRAKPPAGSKSRAPGQGTWGAKPPEAEAQVLFLDVQWKPQICPLFYDLKTQQKSDISVIFAKSMDSHETGKGGGVKLRDRALLARA